jgi:hypothetical protein
MTGFSTANVGTSRIAMPASVAGIAVTLAAFFVTGLSALGLPIALHLVSPLLSIPFALVAGILVGLYASPFAAALVIFGWLFQNTMVALVSPWIADTATFNAIRAYNFILTVGVWIAIFGHFLQRWQSYPAQVRRLVAITLVAFVVCGPYFLIGLADNPVGAVTYLRNILSPLLMFHIAVLTAARGRIFAMVPLLAMAVIVVVYGYLELVAHDFLWAAINGDSYNDLRGRDFIDSGYWTEKLRESGFVYRSARDGQLTTLFNINVEWLKGIQIWRLLGPNFHAISFGYIVCAFIVLAAGLGRWLVVLALVPLALIVGSKGALVMALAALLAIVTFRIMAPGFVRTVFFAGIAAYALFVVVFGLRVGDYHVLGLMAGIRALAANPVGHGIGSGGNINVDMGRIDWAAAQAVGYAPEVVESAIGVLFNQVGLAAFAIIAIYLWLGSRLYALARSRGDNLSVALAFAVPMITVNGLFQEEALFAPLALGAMLTLSGVVLGQAARDDETMPGRGR